MNYIIGILKNIIAPVIRNRVFRLGKYIGVGRICPSPNSSTRSPKQTFV